MTAKWKSLNLGQVSKWDNIQSDRFTLWANHLLQKKGLAIKDLADFADGVLLLNLLEVVSGKTVPRFIKNPRFLQQKIENITIALSFIEKVLDIKVLGCNAKDIADGNLKQKSKESGGDEIAVDAKGKEGLPKSASNSSVNNYTTGANNNNTNNHVEPEPSITAIPITQETAPFTPKVHRPRSYIATLDMLGARPSPKNSFLAKQEFFEKKDQEVRDTRPQTTKAPLVSPTSKEIGVPIMLISARKSDTDESPRSDVTSDVGTITPRSDVSITPRDTPISPRDTPISPRDTPISPRDTPISPRETLVSPRREAPVTPRGEPTDQEVVSSPRSESAEKEEKKLEEKQTPPSTPRAPEVETKPATPRAAETEKEPKLASAPSTPRAAESEQKQEQEPEKVVVQTPEATPETTTVPEPTTPEPTQPEKTPEPTSEPTPETAPETPKQTPATPETESEVPTLTPVTSVEGQPEEKPTEKSEEKPEEQLTPEQIKRADKLKKKESKREKSRRMSEIKKKKEKRRSGTEGELIEGQEEDVKKDIEVKKEEEKPTEEVEEDVSIPEDVAIVLQTHIRGILERLNYDRVLKDIAKRKSDLLASISGNAKALRGTLRVQATFRGRLTRIRVRREAQIYRRNEIAKEILTTERKYVQNLDILVEQFLVPLKAMLLPQQVRNIFSNVEVIRGYNKTILTRLEDRMKVWYSKGQCLGDIFVEVTEFLKVYTTYVNNYNTSIATMTECMENTKFSAFIEKMRVAPECNGLSFASFLIQPIQRLPRYVLLLQDLLKHTTNTHADYAKLSVALKKMKDVADYVNERKREAENLTQVLAIQSKLTGKFENLAEPHRRYVRRGSLAMFDEKGNIRSFFFFLFNDILVYTENKGQNRLFRGSFGRHIPPNWDEQAFNSGKFKFVGRLPLLGLGAGVADVPDTEKDKVSFAFQLITPTTSTLLMANSQDEKVAWMNDLDECVYALLEKERSRKISQLTEDPQSSWHTKVTANTDLEEGDYTGYIYKKANNNSWKQRYFMLRNGMLYYFNEKPPAEVKEVPARVISLVWCSVKVGQVLGRGAVFQLATPARIIFLSSPDLRTMFHYVLRLAIAGQIQALGEDEEVASITENRVNGLAEPPMGDKFEPILELPNSPPLHSHSLSPSPSLSSSPTLASSPTTSVPSFNAHASTSMQDLKDLMNDPANRVCADCGAPGPSWVSTSWGVLLCVACSGIHRRLPSGASGLHSVRSIANRPESVELRSLSNAMANARYEKNVPPEMNKPSQADSYDKKVEWIKAKYSSTDGLEALPTSPPLSRSSSASSSARSTPDSLTHSVSSPVLTLGGSPRKEGSLRDLKDKNKPGERRNSALGLDKALNKTKEGLLYKRQGALLQDDWKLYRFVLKEDHISYFKNKQPKGTIDLMLCSVKEGEVFASGTDRPKYSFELVAPTRIYMLAAESPQARDEWVHAINVCIATMMK